MARILMFGRLADVAGWRERNLAEAPATLFALEALLAEENPALGAALAGKGVQVAVEKAIVRGDVPLSKRAEVAFLAPMSGG
jgi:molybdopterin synthase sulfur carrier subunit